MYKVIERFFDLRDNDHDYSVGDIFPHDGREVDESRISELASVKNKRGIPLIEHIPEKPKKAKKKTEE